MSHKILSCSYACVLAFFHACPVSAQPLAADGLFGDWAGIPVAATDPSGDASGAFDITAVSVTSQGTDLYLRFNTTSVRNLIAGSVGDGDFRVDITHNGKLLELDYRNRSVVYDGSSQSWVQVGARLQSTYADSEFELRVDLASIGASPGDAVSINFSGSDSLSSSITHILSNPAVTPQRRDPAIAIGADFRIASLNTLQTGTAGGTQATRIGNLVDAVDAAVYCFQEEYNSTSSDIASFLAGVDPLGNGQPWNVEKRFDNVIATQFPLHPVPSNDNSYSAAVIDFGGGNAVLLLSIHPKCCGYIGSTQDTRRINQATTMRNTIDDFKAGALGGTLAQFANAPVVLLGDWNLVGSRIPLDVVLGSDMQELLPRNLIGEDVITWQSSGSSFAPGRLDLITHTSANIFPLASFVLDTERLNPTELSAMGLQIDDSLGSDHFMLVADFTFNAPVQPLSGDLNADGFVDGADLGLLLGAWGSTDAAIDLNSDGVVDGADLGIMLGAWGPVPV